MTKCKKKIRKVVRVAFYLYSNEHTFLSIHLGVYLYLYGYRTVPYRTYDKKPYGSQLENMYTFRTIYT